MMLFKWKDIYSVNVAEIDSQHKKLFEIGSRIYELAALNDGYDHYDEIMGILGELKAYTVYHFTREEKVLEEYGYKHLDNHKIEHIFFVKKLERILKRDIDGNQDGTVLDMVKFTADWISSHILGTDVLYRDFLNSKGLA